MRLFPHVDYFKRVLNSLAGAVFVSDCVGCGAPGPRLCLTCATGMPRARQRCIGCRTFRSDGMTCAPCSTTWHVHRLLAATAYRRTVANSAIKALKYQYDRSLVYPLSMRMLTALHAAPRSLFNPLFIPVPLHKLRNRWRGFNQAALLAETAADVGLFSYAEPLKRVRNTTPQTKTPGRAERLIAMSEAFVCEAPELVKRRHVILVDDVSTTGATLNACGQELIKAGALSVTGLVFARV